MVEKNVKALIGLRFISLVVAVVLLSLLAAGLWQGKPEKSGRAAPLLLRAGMTVAEFGRANNVPNGIHDAANAVNNYKIR